MNTKEKKLQEISEKLDDLTNRVDAVILLSDAIKAISKAKDSDGYEALTPVSLAVLKLGPEAKTRMLSLLTHSS